MPLSTLDFASVIKFRFSKPIAGWSDLEQGDNEMTAALDGLDLEVWNQMYAAVFTLAPSGTATINLRSFANLAGESVVMTAAIALGVQVKHTDVEDTGGELTIGPGASNGLVAWFIPDMVIDAPTAGSTRTAVFTGDTTDDGVTVDNTHRAIDLENTGTDEIQVRVIVLGSTV